MMKVVPCASMENTRKWPTMVTVMTVRQDIHITLITVSHVLIVLLVINLILL